MSAVELYIFGSEEAAKRAGFRGARLVHHQIPDARAWSAQRHPSDLRAMILSRVYVTDDARRSAYGNAAREHQLAETLHWARSMLRVAPMAWVEL